MDLVIGAFVVGVIVQQFQHVDMYMDEVFHYPQLVQFLHHNYTWDDKITTPPGLYILPVLLQLGALFQARLLNTLYGFLTFLLFRSRGQGIVALLPPSFFFHFLYYTDSGATLFTLAGMVMIERGWFKTSALTCAVSIWFRQTNAVWLVFIAACGALDLLSRLDPRVGAKYESPRKAIQTTLLFIIAAFRNIYFILGKLYPYGVVAMGCVAFVLWNGGIVLGTKS